jgi:hypothetical protein
MRCLLATALVMSLTAQPGEALAFACNNSYYANSSGHLVHSPTCAGAPGRHTAICRWCREPFRASQRDVFASRRR